MKLHGAKAISFNKFSRVYDRLDAAGWLTNTIVTYRGAIMVAYGPKHVYIAHAGRKEGESCFRIPAHLWMKGVL